MVFMAGAQRWTKFIQGSCPWSFMFLLFLSLFGYHYSSPPPPLPPFWRISPCTIYPFLVDPILPSVDQADTYSSACLISHLPPLSVSCNNRNHIVQGSFPINVARPFVGAFNEEVTSSPWTNPTLYPRACPILLAFSFGSASEAAFDDVSFFPFRP